MPKSSGDDGLGYKQVANIERRTWDKEAYEARAKARQQSENDGPSSSSTAEKQSAQHEAARTTDDGEDDDVKQEFVPAVKGSAGPALSKRAWLKSREHRVTDLAERAGKRDVFVESASGAGWYCKVCDCVLKDSHTYLDHINGRKHQRLLGYSMRVEKSTAAQVRDRMAGLAKELKEKKRTVNGGDDRNNNPKYFEDVVRAKDEDALRRKAERSRKREERKRRREAEEKEEIAEDGEEVEEDEDDGGGGLDPNIAAMMGFSGFASGNKNR